MKIDVRTMVDGKGNDIRDLVYFLAEKYLPDGEYTFTVFYSDRFLNRVSPKGYELHAMTVKAGNLKGCYNIMLNSDTIENVRNLVCHEFAHIEQMVRGDLDYSIMYNEFYWKGERWDGSSSYFSRPWEIEAPKRQREFIKEYKKYKRQCKSKQ